MPFSLLCVIRAIPKLCAATVRMRLSIFVPVMMLGLAIAAPLQKRRNFWYFGINESGAEFGSGNLPGTLGKDYTWPVDSTIDVCSQDSFHSRRSLTVSDPIWTGFQHLPHPVPHGTGGPELPEWFNQLCICLGDGLLGQLHHEQRRICSDLCPELWPLLRQRHYRHFRLSKFLEEHCHSVQEQRERRKYLPALL